MTSKSYGIKYPLIVKSVDSDALFYIFINEVQAYVITHKKVEYLSTLKPWFNTSVYTTEFVTPEYIVDENKLLSKSVLQLCSDSCITVYNDSVVTDLTAKPVIDLSHPMDKVVEELIEGLKGTPSDDSKTIKSDDSKTIKSDGGSNNFYKFPKFVIDIDSLARYWKLSFAEGNILKSLAVNLGARHDGTNPKREKKKALHYAIDRLIDDGSSYEDIMNQVKKQLDKQFGERKEGVKGN